MMMIICFDARCICVFCVFSSSLSFVVFYDGQRFSKLYSHTAKCDEKKEKSPLTNNNNNTSKLEVW